MTPDGKVVELAGQYYQRVADGIHSRLKTVAMLLEQDDKYSLMVSLDVVGAPEDFCTNVQQAVNKKFSAIPAEKIIINAIHTHSAPGFDSFKNWWKENPDAITNAEYREFVIEKIIKAVQQAWDSSQVSGISNALSFANIGHYRRAVYSDGTAEMYGLTNRDDFTGMESGEDSGVDLMFSFDQSGNPTGAIVNVACPSQVMEATYKISSDFMGKLRELLKARFGDNFYTLCQIAPAGCQSPRDLTRSGTAPLWREAGVEIIADRLLKSIEDVYEDLTRNIKYDINLEHSTKKIELSRRRASQQDYLDAKKKMEELENIQDSKSAYQDFCTETHANEKIGLLLFTIRNGSPDTNAAKNYAEKIMISLPGQVTPIHFHWSKAEDIINRCGGRLVMKLWQATENDELSKSPVPAQVDGITKTFPAGEPISFASGESITLLPQMYHTFWAEDAPCIIGEVSRTNNDVSDNRFYKQVGRFPQIEEDESPLHLLCTEYPQYNFIPDILS